MVKTMTRGLVLRVGDKSKGRRSEMLHRLLVAGIVLWLVLGLGFMVRQNLPQAQ